MASGSTAGGTRELGPLVVFLFTIAVIVALWYFSPLLLPYQYCSVSTKGAAGSASGSVGDLFTGLAFAGLCAALVQQHHLLQLQRVEISETQGIMSSQATQLKHQTEVLGLQQFESVFFQLLRLHGESADALVETRGGKPVNGRLAAIHYCQAFVHEHGEKEGAFFQTHYDRAYRNFFGPRMRYLGHYFRRLYHLVKYVDESSIPDKRRYTDLVQAQLSNAEIALLAYNGLGPHGCERFKPLIEKYGLLENIAPETLIIAGVSEQYVATAFGNKPYRPSGLRS